MRKSIISMIGLALLASFFLGCPSGQIRSFLDDFRPYGEGKYDIKGVKIVPGATGFLVSCDERSVDYWMRVYSQNGAERCSTILQKGSAITVPENRIGTTTLESFATYDVVFTPVYGDTIAEGRPVSFHVTPGIVFLNPAASVNGGGNSWAEATNNIQEAIYAAGSMFAPAENKQAELRIAKGNYNLNGTEEFDFSVDKSLNRVNNMKIVGGYDSITNTVAVGVRSVFSKSSDDSGFFKIETGIPVNINFENLEFTGGEAKESGGAIYIKSVNSLTFNNCAFSANKATGANGGAICIDKVTGIMRIENSSFNNNTADDSGGAIAVADSSGTTDFMIVQCDFINNASFNANGGALFVSAPSRLISENCFFYNNFANAFGGAIAFYADTDTDEFQTINSLYLDNTSNFHGAHIAMNNSNNGKANLKATFSTFAGTVYQSTGIHSLSNQLAFSFSGCVFYSPLFGVLVNNSFTTVYNNCLSNKDGNNVDYFYPAAASGLITSDSSQFFMNIASPIGADNKWRTADDGLRLFYANGINTIASSGVYASYSTDFTGRPRFVSQSGTQAYSEAGAYEYYPNP